MFVPNKAIEIFRQGPNHARPDPVSRRSQRCRQTGEQLSDCVVSNNLNILNHEKVRDVCETNEWRKSCNGQWRRFYIQEIYRKRMNKELYNQKDMDVYMKYKNNIYHNTYMGEV